MFEITTFLMRWLFLSNLIRDIAEIQTLPFQPYQPPPPSPTIPTTATKIRQQTNNIHHHHHHRYATTTAAYTEEQWRDQCIRGILSYPPGMQRALVMDGLRTELAQQLCHELYQSHNVVKKYVARRAKTKKKLKNNHNNGRKRTTTSSLQPADYEEHGAVAAAAAAEEEISSTSDDDDDNDNDDGSDSDPFLDADVEIVRAFEEATGVPATESGHGSSGGINQKNQKVATLAISKNETTVIENESCSSSRSSSSSAGPESSRSSNNNNYSSTTTPSSCDDDDDNDNMPSPQQIQQAYKTMRDARDYLPQLVSAVLKSPPALDSNLFNPVQRLRQVMLRQCLQDPSWGIELCWLLEAEVGRAWKTLFEHRQQTGRRLIVVLPAEKAAVLAKIGTEKRETFDLLQDAEQATAYGYTGVDEEREQQQQQQQQQEVLTSMIQQQREAMASSSGHPQQQQHQQYHHHHHHHHKPTRLPSSLSLRRCSHFGDTMHFIDRLTKVSMNLRSVPVAHRDSYLHENLYEMNRRIRRRMVTKGDVSLDVEDNRSPHDWPQITDLTMEHLKYSVHLPLVPQTGVWPNGRGGASIRKQQHVDSPSPEVVRVLNIVVPESRLLTSRERCPFLVHLEVADTGLEGHDARLYASGVSGLGSTVEEALSMSNLAAAASATWQRRESSSTAYRPPPSQHVPYEIPPELLQERHVIHRAARVPPSVVMETNVGGMKKEFPRGGWQSDDQYYQDADGSYVHTDPYDAVRQQEYEQLHQQLQSQQSAQQPPTSHRTHWSLPRPRHSMGQDLLNKVYGSPWNEKCNEIRVSSPYGHLKGWRLASFIMKAGEDIRREALVMQIISKLRDWFREIPEAHRPFMRPYTIMCVGGDAGLVECLSDAKSVDEIKKRTDGFESLRNYFERAFRPAAFVRPDGPEISFETAQDNFLRSLVGYSLVCYTLQIKDRHNANILLDREGHIMHIDFGFVLGDTPKMGKVPIFSERAPFKLSAEFWEVLGGWNISEGGLGVKFCKMFELAFECASLHVEEIATLVESTMLALDSNPRNARAIANGVRSRLRMRGPPGSVQQKMFIMDLVNAALTSWGTSTYDWLQRNMNGYQ